MRRLCSLIGSLLLLCSAAFPQTSTAYINLRTVFGEYLTNVKAADLGVVVDGSSKVPAEMVEPATGAANYCVVLDLNSADEKQFEREKALAQRFLSTVPKPGRDRVCLVLFDAITIDSQDSVELGAASAKLQTVKWSGVHGLRRGPMALNESQRIEVEKIRDPAVWDTPSGMQTLMDRASWMPWKGVAGGLLRAAALQNRNTENRQRITVIFTDGDWTESIPTPLQVMKAQQFSHVRVFAIAPQGHGKAEKIAAERLDFISQGSGGMAYFVSGGGPDVPSLAAIEKRLANSLRVTLKLPALACAAPHSIEWRYEPDKVVRISAAQAVYCSKP